MGCFDVSCAVSGLPITGGEKVLYYLITQNPYKQRSSACYIWDRWFPRTLPLRATYNHYGSVDKVEEGPMRDVWLKVLDKDLHEIGLGDNSVHDVAVRRGMTFDQLLEAVWEGRVLVQRDFGLFDREDMEKKLGLNTPPMPGVPTLARIEEKLRAATLPLKNTEDSGSAGYIVDELAHGRIRVRYSTGRYSDLSPEAGQAALAAACEAVGTEYASVIWAESGPYARQNGGEAVFKPRVGTPEFRGDGFDRHPPPLQVSHAMIREDVWEIMLGQKVRSWNGKAATIEQYRQDARDGWQALAAASAEVDKMLLRYDRPKPGSLFMHTDIIPFTTGPAAHVKELLGQPGVEPDTLINRLAEFAFVQTLMSHMNTGYRPSDLAGQHYPMRAHAAMSTEIGRLAGRIVRQQAAERKE